MITDWVLQLASNLVSWTVAHLPTWSLPSYLTTAATTLGGYIGMADDVVPIWAVAAGAGLVYSVELSVFTWKTTKSLISHIPFIGGHK